MNRLLILVFVFSPVAARYYIADEAHQAAQSIVDTLNKAYATNNSALYLSVFDQSFGAKVCSDGLILYKDLEQMANKGELAKNCIKLQFKDATISEYGLSFVIFEQPQKGEEIMYVDARKIGETYKIVGLEIGGLKCPPPGK